jgi:hypothetical protein
MDRSYNTALVLIRFLGFVSVLMGAMWLVNIAATLAIDVFGAPEWVTRSLWQMASQAFLSGPIWALAGLLILRYSRKLASFVALGTTDQS